jgi:hypothetical protein
VSQAPSDRRSPRSVYRLTRWSRYRWLWPRCRHAGVGRVL